MRKYLILLLLLWVLPVSAWAHPGGTDGAGGHIDHSTGEYHYHHGHSAHQHTDGICPYNFVDATDSSTNSGKSESTKDVPVSSNPTNAVQSSDDKTLDGWLIAVVALFLGCPILMLLVTLGTIITGKIKEQKERKLFQEKQAYYTKLYGYRYKENIAAECGMPSEYTIGQDGLPKELDAVAWGESLTFYISPSGKAFHSRPSCTKNAVSPCHAVFLGKRYPCSKCRPKVPDFSWYDSYQEIMQVAKKYDVPLLTRPQPFVCGYALSKAKSNQLDLEEAFSKEP